MFEGQLTCGGCVSCTMTGKVQLMVVPGMVQTTLLVPMRKPVPLGGTQTTATGPAAFEAVMVKLTGVSPPEHSTTMPVRQLSTGSPPGNAVGTASARISGTPPADAMKPPAVATPVCRLMV